MMNYIHYMHPINRYNLSFP